MSEHNLLIFLLQILLLLGLARGFGELLRHFGHPPLVGEILIGIFLGPTILGRFLPEIQQFVFPIDPVQSAMLETVSWFGVLFLLLETGLEVDVSAAWRQKGPALRVGIIGVIMPLALGFVLSLWLPDQYLADPEQRLTFALFLGTTMAISAIVIIARVLHDLDLVKSDMGLVTLCGYAINDVLAWVIFSLVLAMATQAEGLDVSSVVLLLFFTLVFTGICLTIGLRSIDKAIGYIDHHLPGQPGAILTFVCCLGLLCGAITQWIGLTALFGFFLAGIMAGEARNFSERTRQVISQMVHAIFVPIYFAGIGLQFDFLAHFDFFIIAFVTIVSILGKFLGAWLGALGPGLSREDRLSVAIAFTPSGVTGIVVAGVALQHKILSTQVFIAIIFSTIISSVIVAPWLVWSIKRRKAVDILSFFSRRAIIPNLQGTTPLEVMRELCRIASNQSEILDYQSLFEAVHAREDLMSTGLGHQIAAPHARLPSLTKPIVVFGRSIHGIEWDSPDGLPVHLIFLVLTPEKEEGLQLQILAAIARGIGESNSQDRLLHAEDGHQLWVELQDAIRFVEV